MAPGRGIRPDQRRAALSMAGERPARRRARHSGSGSTERAGSEALLQTPVARAEVPAPTPRDRRPPQLWRCPARGPARRATPAEPLPQQSSGKLTSADTTTGAAGATVQVAWTGAAVSLSAPHHLRPLPSTSPSDGGRRLPARSREGVPRLAAGDVRPSSGLTLPLSTIWPERVASAVKTWHCPFDSDPAGRYLSLSSSSSVTGQASRIGSGG